VPIYLLIFAFDVVLMIHAIKTGRFSPWFYVILMLPGLGGAIYVVVELIPEWTGSHKGRKARQQIASALNPMGKYRALADQLAIVDTISNRAALAQEALNLGRFDEAREHYHMILERPLGDEPAYMLGKARAEYGMNRFADGIASLEELKARWPDFQSADGHLLYAMALEGAGRNDEALSNYQGVGAYFPGAEPRVRQAQLLARLGRAEEARKVAADVVLTLGRAAAYVRRNQKQWLSEAKKLAAG